MAEAFSRSARCKGNGVSGLEQAIRNALERSDRTDAETRARIYQSARNALEGGLRKQDVHDQTVITQQRHRLEMIIRGIETEERAALRATGETAGSPKVRIEPPVSGNAGPAPDAVPDAVPSGLSARREPEREDDAVAVASPAADDGLSAFRPDRRDGPRVETGSKPASAAEKAEPVRPSGRTAKAPRRKRGRLLSLFLVLTTLVVALGTAVWWIEANGLLLTDEERGAGVSNPPSTVQSEDFSPEGLSTLGARDGFSGAWIEAFAPASAADITTRGDATAETVAGHSGPAVRLTSHAADSNGEILVPLSVAILEQMSGKTSTLALTVQSANEAPVEFYVECEFASLGKCGRHRFSISGEKSDVLLKVAFDRSLAPSEAGQLVLNTDVSGAGKSIDLYSVRVLPGE